MTDEQRIVTRFVKPAVKRIAQCDRLQAASGKQSEGLIVCEGEIPFECRLNSRVHLCALTPYLLLNRLSINNLLSIVRLLLRIATLTELRLCACFLQPFERTERN